MPKISDRNEALIRRAIRDAIAIDPLINAMQIKKIVDRKFNRDTEYQYILRLVKKVSGEVAVRIDKEKIAPRVAAMREDFRLARENLLRIAYGEGIIPASDRDRIAAWKAIGMLSKILLDAEMDLGIFDRQGPVLPDAFRSRPIPPEMFDAMLKTAQIWKLPVDLSRQIEHKEAPKVETANTPQSPPVAPPVPAQSEIKPKEPPKGLQQTHATINFEPQPDGTLTRVQPRTIIDPARLIPADPELRLS